MEHYFGKYINTNLEVNLFYNQLKVRSVRKIKSQYTKAKPTKVERKNPNSCAIVRRQRTHVCVLYTFRGIPLPQLGHE